MENSKDLIKVLVITSCSGDKKFTTPNFALAKDLDDIVLRQKKEQELSEYKAKAKDMFISSQNLMVLEGLNHIDQKKVEIDLVYISSGYGVLKADDMVVPYDVNFSAMSMFDLDKRAEFLRINEETYYNAKNYDLVFFLLGYEYLRTLKLPLFLSDEIRQVFFVSHSDEKIIPDNHNTNIIFTGNEESSALGVNPSDLKGHIFRLICQKSKAKPDIFSIIYKTPSYINDLIKLQISENKSRFSQLTLFDI